MAINLYEAGKKGLFQVVSVPNIAMLTNVGIRKGVNISIQNKYRLGGPILLKVENSFEVAIGKDIATQIAVKGVCCFEPSQCASGCCGT